MKHYETKENLQKEFEKIKTIKNKPKLSDIEKFKLYTNFDLPTDNWTSLLYYCQSSYINILDSGYILNETDEIGEVFMIDFNKGTVKYYKKHLDGKIKLIDTATLQEIMLFEDMPQKSYIEIVSEMKEKFIEYYKNYIKIEEEICKLQKLKEDTIRQGAVNIELKVNNLLDDMLNEKKILNFKRRVFYNRLKILDLIEE